MQEIMLAIVLGIAVGLANLLSYKIKFYLSKLSTLCLCTMLFCLGAKIGCDDALHGKTGHARRSGRSHCFWRGLRQHSFFICCY